MDVIIENIKLLTPEGSLEDSSVEIKNGMIAKIGNNLSATALHIPGRGLILAPGFIDLQINGGFGDDFSEDPSTISAVPHKLPYFGVTSFLPTIVTTPLEKYQHALEILHEYKNIQHPFSSDLWVYIWKTLFKS